MINYELPCISPISPLYLAYISPISPLYLQVINYELPRDINSYVYRP